MKPFGKEAIINLYGCNKKKIIIRKRIKEFLKGLVLEIDMVAYGKPLIKRFGEGSLEGISGFQFIETSSIVVHCDETENRVFIDCFSCKDFDCEKAREYSEKFFDSVRSEILIIPR